MMCSSHVAGALTVGVGFAAVLEHAPLPIRVLAVFVTGGAGLLPDLDHPGGRASRSLGFVTRWLALAVKETAIAVYHATRTDEDRPGASGGHRGISHTIPGACAFGLIALIAVTAHPLGAAVVGGLSCGLMSLGFRSLGVGFTLAGGWLTWWAMWAHPGWSWVVPVSVTLGAMAHIGCDAFTNAGVPLLWPLTFRGERWYRVKTPATFGTGSVVETQVVTRLLWLTLGCAVGVVTGVLPALVGAVAGG